MFLYTVLLFICFYSSFWTETTLCGTLTLHIHKNFSVAVVLRETVNEYMQTRPVIKQLLPAEHL